MLRKLVLAAALSGAVAVTPLVLSAGPLSPGGKAAVEGQSVVVPVKKPGKGSGKGSGGKHHHRHGRNIGIGIGVGTAIYAIGCVAVRDECADIYGRRTGAYYRCVRRRGC